MILVDIIIVGVDIWFLGAVMVEDLFRLDIGSGDLGDI